MVDASLFYQDVYGIVKEIPVGRVATYKQIAVLVAFPNMPVGSVGLCVTYRMRSAFPATGW